MPAELPLGSCRGRGEREGRAESARAAAPRLPAPGEGKHAPAHAPLRAPKITRARRRRPPPRAASPPAPRSPTSAAAASPPARRPRGLAPRRPKRWRPRGGASRGAPGSRLRPGPSVPSGLSRGPGRLLTAPGPPPPTRGHRLPPELRAAPYRPRGPVRARVAVPGRVSGPRSDPTANCQSSEAIPIPRAQRARGSRAD